jgi:hypothetical protein
MNYDLSLPFKRPKRVEAKYHWKICNYAFERDRSYKTIASIMQSIIQSLIIRNQSINCYALNRLVLEKEKSTHKLLFLNQCLIFWSI